MTSAQRTRLLWLVLTLIFVVTYGPHLSFGLLGDARFLIAENTYLETKGLWAHATHDYFWSSAGTHIPYWRPVTKVSFFLEHKIFGDFAGGYHLVSLAWFAGLLICVQRLSTRLLAPQEHAAAFAFLPAFWVLLHPAAIEPVALVMARSDVVVVTATLASVHFFLRWQDDNGPRHGALHVVFLALALGSKEVAVVSLPIFAALAVARGRWIRLAPAAVLAGAYLIVRSAVLSDFPSAALTLDPQRVLLSGARYLEVLFPFWLRSPVHSLSQAQMADPLSWARAAAVLVAGAAGAVHVFRRLPRLAFVLFTLGVLTLGPVLLAESLNVPGTAQKAPLADRWALMLVACGLPVVAAAAASSKRRWLRPVLVVLTVVWAAALWLRPESHGYYADEEGQRALEDARYDATPDPWRTAEDRCRAGQRKVLARAADGPADDKLLSTIVDLRQRCGEDPEMLYLELVARAERGQHEGVVALAGQLARGGMEPRAIAPVLYLEGVSLLRLGRQKEAADRLERALARGLRDCNAFLRLAEAYGTGAGGPLQVGEALLAAYECGLTTQNPPQPVLLQEAARAFEAAGEAQRAAGIRARLAAGG